MPGTAIMSDGARRSSARKAAYYAVLVVFIIVATLAIGEVLVRITKLNGPSTFPFRKFDPVLGVSLIPGVEGTHRRCYDGYVRINSHGMRDKERTIEKSNGHVRIAVFSDSLTEAVHVKPEETATYLLEERLNREICQGRCEVLNFSVGGYATLQYYLRYLHDGRRFDPDIVIVVLTDNDLPVVPPDKAAKHKITGFYTETLTVGNLYPSPYLVRSNGQYRIEKPHEPPLANALLSLFRISDLAYFGYKFYSIHIKPAPHWPVRDAAPDWAKFQPNYMFLDPENPVTINAWEQTKFVLDLFVDQARRDNAGLMLVHWGYDVGSNPWYKPIPAGTPLPRSFDPAYASKWFSKYSKDKGIVNYDLGAALSAYVRSKGLVEPYLSFDCDMHLNPQGQAVMAELLFGYVKQSHLLASLSGKNETSAR
jgi:lysophospholipase L1-like esterase